MTLRPPPARRCAAPGRSPSVRVVEVQDGDRSPAEVRDQLRQLRGSLRDQGIVRLTYG